jgi:hypothetical protein
MVNRENVSLVPLVTQTNEEVAGFPTDIAMLNELNGMKNLLVLCMF